MGRHKRIEDDELLAKVREIVVREGITVSSRKIAKEIGISDSVLFQRFGSKEELLFAAMTPPAPDLSTLFAKDREGHAREHLEESTLGLMEYFRKLVPVLMPMASHPSFRYESFRKRNPNSPLEKLIVELMKVWEEKRQKGEIDRPEVGTLVLGLLGVTCGLTMFEWIGAHGGASFGEGTVRDFARLLWEGLAPASQREPPRRRRGARS